MSQLAAQYQAVNLGQGFPAFPAPDFVKQSLINAVNADENQYSRSMGHPKLVEAISEVYSKKLGRNIDPMNEVSVAMGASEALFLAIVGTLNPGDEQIVFEPAFDVYAPQATIAGATTKFVPLNQGTWTIDYEKLEAAITPKTKLIVFNNPNNPTGKLYTQQEIEEFAKFLEKYPQIIVISDEVYEEHLFDNKPMNRIVNLLWDRCVSIHSAGKLFSVTGWKTGWGIGGAEIVKRMQVMHQWTTFCSNTTASVAVAESLLRAQHPYKGFPTYYDWMRDDFLDRRTALDNALGSMNKIKVKQSLPEAGYFYFSEFDPSMIPKRFVDEFVDQSYAFCNWIAKDHGVAAIPGSIFYSSDHAKLGETWVRFAFCKSKDDFEEARKRLTS